MIPPRFKNAFKAGLVNDEFLIPIVSLHFRDNVVFNQARGTGVKDWEPVVIWIVDQVSE